MPTSLTHRWVASDGALRRRGYAPRALGATPGEGGLVPDGYELIREWDMTTDEGWYKHTGKTISAAYYTPGNVTFGPTGMRIRCTREPTNGYDYSAGEVRWNEAIWPQYFYYRFVARMEQPLIMGDFPAFAWLCPYPVGSGNGEGEIDLHETMSGQIGALGGSNPSFADHKVTFIKTPYGAGQVNYTREMNWSAISGTLDFVTTDRVYEGFKYPGGMRTYCDGVLMTEHVRGQGGMSAADWDVVAEDNKTWGLRISYQYGDDPDGNPSGPAGPPQPFNGDRYLNVSEFLLAAPVGG